MAPSLTLKVQRARLVSGCVLFAYATTHLINHSLGLISLEALDAGRQVFLAVWRNPLGYTLIYGGLSVHLAAVIWGVSARKRFRPRISEGLQIASGIAVPLLLALHVVANHRLSLDFGVNDNYVFVLLGTWLDSPLQTWLLIVGLLAVWIHGCVGLHMWFRLKPWYARASALLVSLATLVPLAALAGFVSAGKELSLRSADKNWLQEQVAALNLPGDRGQIDYVYDLAYDVRIGFVAIVVLVVLFNLVRFLVAQWQSRNRVSIEYSDGRRVRVVKGTSVLEASQSAKIPHASVCGGRGRCSTCRVKVVGGLETLPPPAAGERKVLERVGAGPGVRLACQLRPLEDLSVIPLLPANAQARDGFRRSEFLQGREQEIAILFADLRAFTQFSESKLPFDVVFALNQYFRAMGTAVENSGGRLDKFIGDGVMALFGVQSSFAEGCHDALRGAKAMSNALKDLNRQLKSDLDEPLRMGIGIHAGPAIVGEMGFREATSVTAIGDSVNTASRLEAMTKELAVELVLSREVGSASGQDLSAYPVHEVAIRGRVEAVAVYAVEDASTLNVA